MTTLEELPARVDALGTQISQLRAEMHEEFSAIRGEIRAGDDETRRVLLDAIKHGDGEVVALARALSEDVMAQARALSGDVMAQSRVLYEDLKASLTLINEDLPRRRKRGFK